VSYLQIILLFRKYTVARLKLRDS